MRKIKLEIGGIVFSFALDKNIKNIELPPNNVYKNFLIDKDEEISIIVKYEKSYPLLGDNYSNFCLGEGVSLYYSKIEDKISLVYCVARNRPYFALDLYDKLKKGILKLYSISLSYSFLNFPIITQLLFISLLSYKNGILLHSAGIIDRKGKGIVFAGNSGTGKTTLCQLYRDINNSIILNDDRIIIRCIEDRFYLFGTPWSGSGNFSSTLSFPLHKIFLLNHGENNTFIPLSGREAFVSLMNLSFLPFYDYACMKEVIDFFGKLVREIPTLKLSFKPDKDVLELIDNYEGVVVG
ncbi:MAG: hypothetical protein NC822_05050 [Candidatus Omnitrophica bacterium]|nr:hypothetical protein [Candidatus Omnitrophota bacterium]MCM8826697.1 hypothetical protein [Candidatus Omnitrophota bacterium]